MYLEIDKIKAIAVYLAENIPNLGITKALKLFYYCDFISVLERGRPITNDTYYHLPYGPVPSQIKDHLYLLKKEYSNQEKELSGCEVLSSIFVDILTIEGNGSGIFTYKSKSKKSNLNYISEYEKNLLDDIIDQFKETSASVLTTKTHGEIPYIQTSSNNIIDYKLAFYLKRNTILPNRKYPLNPEIAQTEFFGS